MIRNATLIDLPILSSLDREYFQTLHWSIEQFRAEITNKDRYFVVKMIENEIIGYAGINCPKSSDVGDIMTVAISPEYRRKGFAKELMHDLESWARRQGALVLNLEVDIFNSAAIALYENLGFEKSNVRKNYYGYGKDGQVMRKAL